MTMFSNRAAGIGCAVMLGVMTTAGMPVPAAARTESHSHSVSIEDDGAITRCDQVRVRFGDERAPLPTARSERQFVLPRSATPLLELHLTDAGGMALSGWDSDEYSVTACLVAGAQSQTGAAETLRQVTVGLDGGRLAADGPAGADWLVYLLVCVPEDAVLDLLTENAPIDLREVSGRIKARTRNGPIALARCRGTIDAAADNGPVSVLAGAGRQHLRASNGPLDIRLEGRAWDGEGIEARADNGPVSLSVPEGYASGIRVEMSRHSPLRCLSEGCESVGEVPDNASRRLDIGSSPPVIRITAGNGPVDIDTGATGRRSVSI